MSVSVSVSVSPDMVNNTNPIDETIYITDDKTSYSILNQINIDKKNMNNYFILNTTYYIKTFMIPNPNNLSFCIDLDGIILPPFTNDTINKIATFNIDDYKDIIPHVGDNLYIDNNKYKRLKILYTNNFMSNINYTDITITGFEIINEVPNPINIVLRKYNTTYTLKLNAPTDSIDIYGKCNISRTNPSSDIYEIQLSLDNVLYSVINITPADNNNLIRIKFNNLDGKYKEGLENNYLSPSINSHTINCSQLQYIDIVFINFNTTNILQNVYTAYSYPDRKPIFTYT